MLRLVDTIVHCLLLACYVVLTDTKFDLKTTPIKKNDGLFFKNGQTQMLSLMNLENIPIQPDSIVYL